MSRQVLDANEAVASVAYRVSEVIAIYPITPASAMGEHSDAWAADGRPNLWGAVPTVMEMQSEAGAAGAVHGALQAGALTTTFTASQGLLLMLPDLYKVAGELTSFCMHVAARALATHALSIFGDHSDVMAARATGMAMIASGSAQEAQDLAAIGHAVTLRARIPVLHFFDGFRTSHELSPVDVLDDATLLALLDPAAIAAHRARSLDPERPVVRGTSQNADTFFQAREAGEAYYRAFPAHFAAVCDDFEARTGRRYAPFHLYGDPMAERVVIAMGSATGALSEVVDALLARGERVAAIDVHLFRPFLIDAFLDTLPATVRSVAVLDRTKEPGSAGEPLLLEVTAALVDGLAQGRLKTLPRVIGGRYGLASKEVDPPMLAAVFRELSAEAPRRRFTIGIVDDVCGSSLTPVADFDVEPGDVTRAVFYGLGSDGTVSANKATLKILGEDAGLWVQGHFEYDSRKSGSTTSSYLRFGPHPIRSTWRIRRAGFVGVHDPKFFDQRDVLAIAEPGAVVLVNHAPDTLWDALPREAQEVLIARRCRLFAVDAYAVAEAAGLGRRINTVMQVCFFALSNVLPVESALDLLRGSIQDTWGKRGPEVVKRNLAALDASLAGMKEIALPAVSDTKRGRPAVVPSHAPAFVRSVTAALLEGLGDSLPVSAFPPDGTWPVGTSRFEKRAIALDIPIWQPDVCVQCNRCVEICPHAAIRAKVVDPQALEGAPVGFRAVPEANTPALEGLQYVLQVAPEDCTGCGLCVEVCPAKDRTNPRRKALVSEPLAAHRQVERDAFAFFETLENAEAVGSLPIDDRTSAFRDPLFEFSGACSGCGETPYVRLLTQLFGDRLMIANATGCSSIYGGNLPTTPYTTGRDGRGPAWANSLFEDNAEFGFGMRLGVDAHTTRARQLLHALAGQLPGALVAALAQDTPTTDAALAERRRQIVLLRGALESLETPQARELATLADHFVPRSVWLVGGDGWAYDIGYGGLDHVLASNRNVNVLVLDTEVYSNTGGQASKSTPIGAAAKFATAGKATGKKDLGLLAMSYGHVYVAKIAMQSRSKHTVQTMLEAEAWPGPSLLIAHSPCVAHGYDLVRSPAQQRRAVSSGMWPLYRFDPRRVALGEAPLVLDSADARTDVGEYMEHEARFKMVELRDPERYAMLVQAAREGVRAREALYHQLAGIHLPVPEADHG
jgi:pyruvate-ferredoxin/flavodoxin oxidoreductase